MTLPVKAMRDVFLSELVLHMENDNRIFFVAADFGSPVLDVIAEKFPDRFINVGIAEQNLINISTGLALEGYTVYAYAIAPFITMRCYEQVRVNLAILSQIRPLNINLIGVGAGYSYVVSGPTHQCLEDLSIMRTLPNLEVFSPTDWMTAKAFVDYSVKHTGPKYLRFDAKPMEPVYQDDTEISIEKGFCELRKGGKVCVVSTGYMTRNALEVADKLLDEGIHVGVTDIFMLKTFDEEALKNVLKKYAFIISFEEGFINKGGLDSMLLHFMNKHGIKADFANLGLKDEYSFHIGERDTLHELNDAGKEQLMAKIRGFNA
jgi:transketolase